MPSNNISLSIRQPVNKSIYLEMGLYNKLTYSYTDNAARCRVK